MLESAVTGGIGLTLLTMAWVLTPKGSNYPGMMPIVLANFGLSFSGYSVLRILWYVGTVLSRGSRSRAAAKKGLRSGAASTAAPPVESMAARDDLVANGRFVRFVMRYFVPFLALAFPSGHQRRTWIQDVVATTASTYEPRRLARFVGHIARFPINVIRAWVEFLGVTTPSITGLRVNSREFMQVINEGVLSGLLRLRAFVTRSWRGWVVAMIFAVLAALLMEPVMYMVTYLLHHGGYEFVWEKYFPLK